MSGRKVVFAILFFIFYPLYFCFSQGTSAVQIEKMQQDLEKEKALRMQLQEEKEVLIKRILLEGITLLSEEQIKGIILPLEKRWLSKTDIQSILDSITATYKQNGYPNQPAKISYQIQKGDLKINMEE